MAATREIFLNRTRGVFVMGWVRSDIRRFLVGDDDGWMDGLVRGECATRRAMSTVEIAAETQKHPFAVMLLLGFKAAPIVAYV